jgi:hypothetical protein
MWISISFGVDMVGSFLCRVLEILGSPFVANVASGFSSVGSVPPPEVIEQSRPVDPCGAALGDAPPHHAERPAQMGLELHHRREEEFIEASLVPRPSMFLARFKAA